MFSKCASTRWSEKFLNFSGLVLVMTEFLVLATGSGLTAQELSAKREVTERELLFREIPVVVTAAKKEQPITEAPATVFVITSENIKQSGATNIPDVLRTVPGVDVMTITARNQQVGIRGFNTPQSNKILVLIDGRSVYWDSYGLVLWDLFPVGLEEIERIEIVRSPSSSLYGANAYCGVINIITKTPAQLGGSQIGATGGEHGTLFSSLLHSGISEKIDYKVSAEYNTTDEWRTDKMAGEITRGNALFEYKVDEKSRFAVSGGRNHFKNRDFFASESIGKTKMIGNFDYLQLDYNYPDIKFRTFMKREDVDNEWLRTGNKDAWLTTEYDTEFQHSLDIGEKNSFIWGADYRYNTIDKNLYIPYDYTQNLWALFLEDEAKITDNIRLTLGGRYDDHPLVDGHFSPRGTVSYSLAKERVVRLSVAKAYRNPTFTDSYTYVENQYTTTLPSPFPQMNIPYTFINQGNKNLKSEGVTSYEIGYLSTRLKKVRFNMNLFYNEYASFFTVNTVNTYYTANELFPGSPAGLFPKRIVNTFDNGGNAQGIGGETILDVFITDWLSGTANYSYQQITDKDDDPATITVDEKNRIRPDYPKNKANAGLSAKFKNGISANLLANWVDKTERIITDIAGNEYSAEVREYTILNTRVAYALLREKAEISVSVFNLFDDRHYEYPVGINLPDFSSDKIARKITGSINYRF